MSALARALWNPIVAKEYRSRMRTWRSPVALMVYILLLGGLGWAIFAAMATAAGSAYGSPQTNYGPTLFLSLVVFQVVLLAFITPALTAGAISGERERQTIDLLFVTLIPPFSIIWGKLLASISYVLLLLLLSIPIFSLVFLFGGVEADQVFYAFVVSGVTALTLGTIGIAFSTLLRRTLPATVASYGAAFLLLAGSPLYGLLFPTDIDPGSTTYPAPPVVSYLGPILPLVTIGTNAPIPGYGVRFGGGFLGGGGGGGTSCFSSGSGPTTCYPTASGAPSGIGPAGGAVAVKRPVGPPVAPTGATLPSGPFAGWQYWQASVVMQLGICAVALAASALLLPPVRRRFRPAGVPRDESS